MMENKFDIVALGELLIDFTYAGLSEAGRKIFEQNPGGAPANLLTAASHMGRKTAMIGKVGNDMHGLFLKKVLEDEAICTDYIQVADDVFTTLAFVGLDEKGDREFSFARKPGADTQLQTNELPYEVIKNCRLFHVGSLSLTDEPARSATYDAVKTAAAAGAVVSYDPNYRASLWKDEATAVQMMKSLLPYTNILKVSDEESLLLTGKDNYEEAAEDLLAAGPSIVAITLGGDGVYLVSTEKAEHVAGYPTEAVDTTGAGDSFFGGFLSQFVADGRLIEEVEWEAWIRFARFGNAVAGLCVQKRGGIPSIPSLDAVKILMEKAKA